MRVRDKEKVREGYRRSAIKWKSVEEKKVGKDV